VTAKTIPPRSTQSTQFTEVLEGLVGMFHRYMWWRAVVGSVDWVDRVVVDLEGTP